MEADWSAEISPGLPCIDASWNGFVDLRTSPHAIDAINEAVRHPSLREALLELNGEGSPVLTAKCDTWRLTKDEIDPHEFGTDREHALAGFASYIDVLERNAARFISFAFQEQRARDLTALFRTIDLQQCRADIVVRAAAMGRKPGFGMTFYIAGCGADEADAYAAWRAALAAAATIAAAHSLSAGE